MDASRSTLRSNIKEGGSGPPSGTPPTARGSCHPQKDVKKKPRQLDMHVKEMKHPTRRLRALRAPDLGLAVAAALQITKHPWAAEISISAGFRIVNISAIGKSAPSRSAKGHWHRSTRAHDGVQSGLVQDQVCRDRRDLTSASASSNRLSSSQLLGSPS